MVLSSPTDVSIKQVASGWMVGGWRADTMADFPAKTAPLSFPAKTFWPLAFPAKTSLLSFAFAESVK